MRILSGDRDLWQLVDDEKDVKVLAPPGPTKGASRADMFVEVGEEHVRGKLGVSPRQVRLPDGLPCVQKFGIFGNASVRSSYFVSDTSSMDELKQTACHCIASSWFRVGQVVLEKTNQAFRPYSMLIEQAVRGAAARTQDEHEAQVRDTAPCCLCLGAKASCLLRYSAAGS